MGTIKAPFNFVPLSDKVFFPDWANKISHDIPFRDGISGCLELKITAESPIFVRNGHTKEEGESKSEEYKSFSHINGQYFIPSTSLKGSIRNVLEILSFGKMRLDQNAQFAQREWDNTKLYSLKGQQNKVNCGWLKREGSSYVILDCGKPYRIGHDRIDEYIRNQGGDPDVFSRYFKNGSGFNLNKEIKEGKYKGYDPKTAVFKYKLTENIRLENLSFSIDKTDNKLTVNSKGDIRGSIVFTGQPDQWIYPRPTKLTKGAGKFYEFVFVKPTEEKRFSVSKTEYEHFRFIYLNSPDWIWAKNKIDKTGIPVFFREEKGKIKDFGLAFLYKLPYEKSPHDTLFPNHRKQEPDLAECIFGYANFQKTLKGRVWFSSAFSVNAERDNSISLSLGSPKASYYPIYIEQEGNRGQVISYKTYNDSIIRGWKRYPVREKEWINNTGNNKIDSLLTPLKKGAIFSFKVRFHNLKEIELGALLSAITFHNSSTCSHQIGQGKPYGLGRVKIEVVSMTPSITKSKEELMSLFEKTMVQKLKIEWHQEEQIKQLFTMAQEAITNNMSHLFTYMEMDNTKKINQFLDAKKNKEFLERYTLITKKEVIPVSLYEQIKLKWEEDERIKEELEWKRRQEEDQQKLILAKKQEEEELVLRRQQQLEAGLSALLEAKFEHGPNEGCYKVSDFKGCKVRVEDWLKKSKSDSLQPEQHSALFKTLNRLYHTPIKKEQKAWLNFEDKQIWGVIIRWVGKEIAFSWFNKLTKQH